MKYLFLFLFVFVAFSFGANASDIGGLPSWQDLGMTKEDYFFLNGLAGLLIGSVFTFLITR